MNLEHVSERAMEAARAAWPEQQIQFFWEGIGSVHNLSVIEYGIERLFGAALMAEGDDEIWLHYLWASLEYLFADYKEQLQ